MKFKDDFNAQAGIAWTIRCEMDEYPEYRKLLEERIPAMADKGQAESLRIKLRILLEMLGEAPAPPPRSAEEIIISMFGGCRCSEAYSSRMKTDPYCFYCNYSDDIKTIMHAYASQFRPVVTDEEIEREAQHRWETSLTDPITELEDMAKWMREKMNGK